MSNQKIENTKRSSFLIENLQTIKELPKELWQLTKISVAFIPLWSMLNHLYLSANYIMSTPNVGFNEYSTAAASSGVIPLFKIIFELPEPVATIILVCVITGTITYLILKEVCEEEWVKEKVKVKECWEEVKWYNPFSWVKAIVCTVKEVLKWVLKQICKIKEIFVTILTIACIVAGIIIFV